MFLLFVFSQELYCSLLTVQRYERNTKVFIGICFNFWADYFNFKNAPFRVVKRSFYEWLSMALNEIPPLLPFYHCCIFCWKFIFLLLYDVEYTTIDKQGGIIFLLCSIEGFTTILRSIYYDSWHESFSGRGALISIKNALPSQAVRFDSFWGFKNKGE